MILVDTLMFVAPGSSSAWRFPSACHMMSDQVGDAGLAELRAMARKLGLRDEWLQTPHAAPHYDLSASKRAQAIRLGALPVDSREFTQRCTRPWLAYCRERRMTSAT